ncbi:o-succinylbenzoate synthase [Brevibacillus sp. NRS-1366]|uniref:o-succinylbenzoate synthase n=1 Tax=Brevibacillus sp. NRS-1366 TaxID=3233899 RepID=UPI003D24BB58
MKIDRVVLRKVVMPLINPFQTSFGTIKDHSFLVVEVHSEGITGYAEVTTEVAPLYNEESVGSSWHVISEFLLPMLFANQHVIEHPSQVSQLFKAIRRNNLAKSGVESAIWDLYAKQNNLTLAKLLSGEKKEIEVGVSIGIQKDVPTLLSVIEQHVDEGYKRIKIKIKPGWDLDVVRQMRERFPDLPLMADANSAYTLNDIALFKEMDQFELMMIEQPLAHDDIVDHSILQQEIRTPLCLDESIHHVDDVRKALYLGSCRIINIKIGRVGGLHEAKKIHDYCLEHQVPVWCGGMLESGIGRAHNIAITTLSNFTLPGDTAASSRYWEQDIIEPEVEVTSRGTIIVPEKPGIGYDIIPSMLEKYTEYSQVFKPE